MARAQSQNTGYIVGMVVFGLLWATAMAFLISMYVDREGLVNDRNAAIAAKNRAISDAEERSIALAQEAREGSATVAGLLEQARQETARLASGDPANAPSVVAQKRDELIKRIQDQIQVMAQKDPTLAAEAAQFADVSMMAGFDRTFRLLQREYDLRIAAEARSEDTRAKLDEAVAQNAAQKTDFEERARQMDTKLADAERSRQDYSAQRDKQVADLERQINELRNDCNATITEVRKEKTASDERYADIVQRYNELQGKLGTLQVTPQTLTTARQADGVILKAVPGDGAVYIDLGHDDHLILGMEFAVYSSRTGIPADGRAKAGVRVESINSKSAECKVLWVAPNDVILESDLIANPIYDRDRPLSFTVAGDFDVDRDGRIDPDGAARIEALIRDWGGQVVDDLSALTDFVILGAAPPAPKDPATVSPELASRNEALKRNFDRYQKIVESARTLSVPVLTQDVFKNFLGYTPTYAAVR